MTERAELIRSVDKALRNEPVVMLGGPRQSGNTALARCMVPMRPCPLRTK